MPAAALYQLVHVGARRLLGEVVRVQGDTATIQVYEDTTGLWTGEPVTATGGPLRLELGPGLLGSVLDGVGRPLARIAEATGDFIAPGAVAPTLDPQRRWTFEPTIQVGATVSAGDVLGRVQESPGLEHRVLVPPDTRGVITRIEAGDFRVSDAVAHLEDGTALALSQRWPVRLARPAARRLPAETPFVTGQRVLDFLFPVAEGGSVAVPGGFGTGKTVIEQTLAKYAWADVIVFIGCGERGNEMAEVLTEFPQLRDPRTGRSLLDRTVLVVNTSNMPVAARESSVYVGMTIAEYYRDMGYRVALMADSLSRWAEALREVSARLQEMPGEEGYPTYLANRLASFYERAGRVQALGRPQRTGALTVIGAVSPPGGDFSEPVTQAALRVAGALWALDPELARQRHFPAVDWRLSYSLHADATEPWFREHGGEAWPEVRRGALELLEREAELREIAGLVGAEALQDPERLLLDVARDLREVVLAQSAFAPNDAFSTVTKTYLLAQLSMSTYQSAARALAAGISLDTLNLARVRRALVALKTAAPEEWDAGVAEARAAVGELTP
ncbi:MAG: V-type ATP synthase subunit A [Gemmatimonadetes bacterium]|nr:V-type ATP synthase subunit A [Gemmatimonadota bacterium]